MISRQLYNFVYFLVKDVLKISYHLNWCMNIKQHSTSCQGFFFCMVQIKENTQQCKYLLIACPYTCTSIFPLSIWAQGVEYNQELGPDSGKGQCCVLQKNLPPNFKMLVIFKLMHIIDLNTNKTYLYLKKSSNKWLYIIFLSVDQDHCIRLKDLRFCSKFVCKTQPITYLKFHFFLH